MPTLAFAYVLHLRRSIAIAMWVAAIGATLLLARDSHASDAAIIKIGYVRPVTSRQQPISLLDEAVEDDGLAGARLAVDDNNGTGRFTNQQFVLEDIRLKPS